jgi:TRAP-type C4-dicarboxylate transport system permease small subunit
MNIIRKCSALIDAISGYITGLSVLVMFLTIFIQVFMRYIMRNPLLWSEELARYCMILMTFTGTTMAIKRGMLANIDLFVIKLTKKIQRIIRIIVNIYCILILLFLSYECVLLLSEFSVVNQVAPALRIPMRIIYGIMPVGMIGMIFQFLVNIIENIVFKEAGKK